MAHVEHRSQRTALGVGRAIHASVDAGVHHETRTQARLHRDVDRATRKPPAAKRMCGSDHGHELRVRRGVCVRLTTVASAGNDLVAADHDGTDGDLAKRRRTRGLVKSHPHVLIVLLAHVQLPSMSPYGVG